MTILKSEEKAKRFVRDLKALAVIIISLIIAILAYLMTTGMMDYPEGPMFTMTDLIKIYNNTRGAIYGN